MHIRKLATQNNKRGKEEYMVETPPMFPQTLPKKALKK